MTNTNHKKWENFLSYCYVVAVAVLLAFNYQLFIVKNNFAPAGINGIATMIQHTTGFSIAYMSILINVPLCILAYFLVDKTFAKKKLCFCLVYSGRHTCASLMHKMGLSPKEVQDYLGHSTVSVTLNIYTHLDWSNKENAAKAMENAVKLPENTKIANPWGDPL